MKKLLCTLLLSATISFAGLIDAVALIVNDEPITLYDIDKRMVQGNLSKKDAVSSLIDEVLYKQLIEQNNISVDVFDMNNYLEKVAASNGMDLYTFKSVIKQKYKDYSKFEDETRSRIEREKLIRKLVRGNLKIATDEDLRIYYDNNEQNFTTFKSVDVIQYGSKNKAALIAVLKNPMAAVEGVSQERVTLAQDKLNPQLRYLLNDTKEGVYTPIFTANQEYVTLFISKKNGVEKIPFETVKEKIFSIVMQKREKSFLKDYFEKQKLTADIKVLR